MLQPIPIEKKPHSIASSMKAYNELATTTRPDPIGFLGWLLQKPQRQRMSVSPSAHSTPPKNHDPIPLNGIARRSPPQKTPTAPFFVQSQQRHRRQSNSDSQLTLPPHRHVLTLINQTHLPFPQRKRKTEPYQSLTWRHNSTPHGMAWALQQKAVGLHLTDQVLIKNPPSVCEGWNGLFGLCKAGTWVDHRGAGWFVFSLFDE